MKRRYNGGSSNRNSRKGKKRRTKKTSVSLNLDLEDHLPSSDFSYNSDDDVPYRPSEGIDSDDSLTFGLDDLEPENAVPFRRRWKKRNGRAWKKKMRRTQKASMDGINGGEEDEELEEIHFGDPSWKGKKKKKGKQARKGRKEGDPPLIWEVLEEENERWIDAHENDDPNLDDHGETVPEMADPPPDLVMPLLRFQKEWLAWAVKQEESSIRGGILADEMGMGKTIQAISLVLATRAFCPTDLDFGSPSSSSFCPTDLDFGNPSSSSSPALPKIKGTLVICPLVAVVQWVNEITKFTSEGSVKVLVYHGAKREKGFDQFFKYDFILTTYSIVEADYRKNNMPPKERCVWCGKLFYPNKMTIHLKYFCGPSAVKTAKQSKQAKKKHVGNVGSSKKKFDVIEEEEEDVNNDNKVGKGKGSAKGKKPGRAPKKPGIRSSNDNSAARSGGSSARKSVLHSVKWERIILDEAHYIKDRRSSTARAVLTLQSSYKWALSGTPLQNRVGELYSLIRFLQISPYSYYYCKDCDCKSLDYSYTTDCPNCVHKANRHFCWWNRYVAKPIQTSGYVNDGRRAMVFLKHKLLKSVVLRRTKKGRAADLALPPRIVSLRRDYLDNTEEDFYEALYTRSQAQFNTYVEAGTLMNNYAHIFDLLTRLRQAVDHPYLVIYSKTASPPDGSKNVEEQECGICHEPSEDPVVTSCEHVFCKACLLDYSTALGQVSCPSCSRPLTVDLTTKRSPGEQSPVTTVKGFKRSSILHRIHLEDFKTSTKIEALREEIRSMVERDGSAKGIVFSQFTSFLDLINYSLQKSGIKCVQLVGSMSMVARDEAIRKFSNEPDCKIFLMSLKAGGVALNLTVASYVFLMDPWWNPAVEQQAQDRIHRIGQFKPIRTIRFVIENTIEERILRLQEKKELMFEVTVGGSSQAMGRLTEEDLRFLFYN
ncbi:DNA repair protein RAD16 [Magnolia sinica]|uniref:DNA repair protein RAD16 n=1 Tax=Magnolia sinica TaxID=86752 RepID=UPI002659BA12|nr:DNA repair protein RAD16 [Magnolia sinica]